MLFNSDLKVTKVSINLRADCAICAVFSSDKER